MPLLDHFHRPLSAIHEWESFHTQWGSCIAADLNRRLPKRFLASAPMHLGAAVSADVAEKELHAGEPDAGRNGTSGGVAVATEPEVYAPPETALVMPLTFPDDFHIEIRDTHHGQRVLAVVELVSPGNKKEADERVKFAAKCLSILGKGIGLVVVDIVTERYWNLHNEMVRLAGHDEQLLMADDPHTYATAYRPIHRNDSDGVDLWPWSLTIGLALPVVPLALSGYGCVRLDLEATYAEACERSGIT